MEKFNQLDSLYSLILTAEAKQGKRVKVVKMTTEFFNQLLEDEKDSEYAKTMIQPIPYLIDDSLTLKEKFKIVMRGE
ncbi:hypothetical protein Q7A53_05350 [Halobacillus rhizosphaerae]|uniref:hypothetical protein n=1 Tax=Halobacillus rhizosphaerae TaxID=3064889 RepID=UPI00398BA2E8